MNTYSISHNVAAVIMAAGRSSRMNGVASLSKVFLKIADKPILDYISNTLSEFGIVHQCLIISENKKVFEHCRKNYPQITGLCLQEQPCGTAAAVASSAPYFRKKPISYASNKLVFGDPVKVSYVLICNGDVPFLSRSLLRDFVDFSIKQNLNISLIGTNMPRPKGYGRIILDDDGRLKEIIEEKDASIDVLKQSLCNSGIYLAKVDFLFSLLENIDNNNKQQEYYFTDCIKLAVESSVGVYITDSWEQLMGVNTVAELDCAEKYFLRNKT